MDNVPGDGASDTEPLYRITRERLLDGSLMREFRARALPGTPIRSDAELEASLDATLAGHDPAADLWLFGYGSLIWNPAFVFAEQVPAFVRGYHRRYCLWMPMGRGTPERPGLMLALDRGGGCRGVAFRIPAPARAELLLVWRREMLGGAYLARWVCAETPHGVVPAVTFVVDRSYVRYAGHLSDDEVAARIATARGPLGSCADYLRRTTEKLAEMGFKDRGLERVRRAVARVQPAA